MEEKKTVKIYGIGEVTASEQTFANLMIAFMRASLHEEAIGELQSSERYDYAVLSLDGVLSGFGYF